MRDWMTVLHLLTTTGHYMIAAFKLVNATRSYTGVPYKHHGRDRRGVDCVGLLLAAAGDLGLQLAGHFDYTQRPDPRKLLAGILDNCERDKCVTVLPGRVALMRFSKWAGATHTALITDVGIIHAYENRKYVVEHRLNDVWCKRIVATFTINGVDYG